MKSFKEILVSMHVVFQHDQRINGSTLFRQLFDKNYFEIFPIQPHILYKVGLWSEKVLKAHTIDQLGWLIKKICDSFREGN